MTRPVNVGSRGPGPRWWEYALLGVVLRVRWPKILLADAADLGRLAGRRARAAWSAMMDW